nr:RNA-directed DNA polymerase, eukaryota [Tanacetum cinerariifolium]
MDIDENLVSSFTQKRLCIKTKQADNISKKFKVIFKGNVYMAHAKELFAWTLIFLDHKESEYISDNESLHGEKNKSVGSQNGKDDLVDDSDVEGVFETFFGDKHPSPNNSVCNSSKKVVEQQSEDLFCIYDMLNKKPKCVAQDSDSSLSHPPGFTSEVSRQENDHRGVDLNTKTDKVNSPLVHTKVMNNSHEGSNSSFIALIPKVTDAKFVTDFRPTSLIGCVYKVVTKILANRLATCKWIRGTFSSTMASILVNGSPTSEFPFLWTKTRRSFASYLFSIIMESLHISFSRATSDGLFKGIQIQGSMDISHFFYADDAIFIGEWSDSNLDNIVKILKCFFLASGLKINIQKSQALGVGVPRNIINQAASLIGCAVMQNPFRYLGVMVGDSMSGNLLGLTRFRSYVPDYPSGRLKLSVLEGSNSLFIALIPKVTDAKFVTDFRPASLIGCVYKVVTKILANRLATVISDLVFDIQLAFVANRQI